MGEVYLTQTQANNLVSRAMSELNKPNNLSSKEFQELANGLFQAEASVTARVSNKGYISPVVTINQNLSKESLELFV